MELINMNEKSRLKEIRVRLKNKKLLKMKKIY